MTRTRRPSTGNPDEPRTAAAHIKLQRGHPVVLTAAIILLAAAVAWSLVHPTRGVGAPEVRRSPDLLMRFEANQGQADAQVRFLSRGPGYTLLLTPTDALLALTGPPARGEPPALQGGQRGRAGWSPSRMARWCACASSEPTPRPQ